MFQCHFVHEPETYIFNESVLTAQQILSALVIKTSKLILYRELIQKKNLECTLWAGRRINLEPGGRYSNQNI